MDSRDAKKLRKNTFLLVLLLILLLDGTGFAAKNVIVVIGGGMGFNQVAAARIYSGGQDLSLIHI